MGYLLTDDGFTPPDDRLTDDTGTIFLTDDLPSSSSVGSDLIIFTTMMSFLLMVFGGDNATNVTDTVNNLAAKIP